MTNLLPPSRGSRAVATRDQGQVTPPPPSRPSVPDEYSDAVRLWPHAYSGGQTVSIDKPVEAHRLNYRPDIQTTSPSPVARYTEPTPPATLEAPPSQITDQSTSTPEVRRESVVERCVSRASDYEPGANTRALGFGFAVGGTLLLGFLLFALIGGILTGGPGASRQRFQERFGYDRDTGRSMDYGSRGGSRWSSYDDE